MQQRLATRTYIHLVAHPPLGPGGEPQRRNHPQPARGISIAGGRSGAARPRRISYRRESDPRPRWCAGTVQSARRRWLRMRHCARVAGLGAGLAASSPKQARRARGHITWRFRRWRCGQWAEGTRYGGCPIRANIGCALQAVRMPCLAFGMRSRRSVGLAFRSLVGFFGYDNPENVESGIWNSEAGA